MRVVVTGGMHAKDHAEVDAALDALHATGAITALAHGGDEGAALFARDWAHDHGAEVLCFASDYTNESDAYAKRDRRMIDQTRPDVLVVFSPGDRLVKRCVEYAKTKSVVVYVPYPDGG